MKIHGLYLDENGHHSLNHHSSNYTVLGVITRDFQSERLKIESEQIKFKYWNDTSVVFHSKEMGKKINHFSILQDAAIKQSFEKDLFHFLHDTAYKLIAVSVNKVKARQDGWSDLMVFETAWQQMFSLFIEFLSANKFVGNIITESSGSTDLNLYKIYSGFLIRGYPPRHINVRQIKSMLTSISFVSKHNHDIETQIADIFAYAATQKCLRDEKVISIEKGTYEEKMCNIYYSKLATLEGKKAFLRL